jgi:hypothetical protein
MLSYILNEYCQDDCFMLFLCGFLETSARQGFQTTHSPTKLGGLMKLMFEVT